MSRREAEDWARSKGMLFVESSAKTKIGIQQVFNEVVQKVRCNVGRRFHVASALANKMCTSDPGESCAFEQHGPTQSWKED